LSVSGRIVAGRAAAPGNIIFLHGRAFITAHRRLIGGTPLPLTIFRAKAFDARHPVRTFGLIAMLTAVLERGRGS
jgi:hypothetical protein